MFKMSVASENMRRALHPHNILFLTQISCIFIVVCVALCNLTLEIGNQHLWTMILTSSLAFLMPGPKFKLAEAEKDENNVTLKGIKPAKI